MQIKLAEIPKDFSEERNLLEFERDGWIYFEMRKGVYGLPQSGKLANNLLEKRLNKAGYHQMPTTPGLWKHIWRPIIFCLIVDNFGI